MKSLLPFVSNRSSVLFLLVFVITASTFLLNVVNCSSSSPPLSLFKTDTTTNTNNIIDDGSSSSTTTTTTMTTTDTIDTTTRNPTLPKDGDIQIIFSDLDGTLVHFEKYYKPNGSIDSINEKDGTAVYKCHQDGSQYKDHIRDCILMPTLTMGPGVISLKTIELINKLRSQGKVIFVYISGARKSTMLKRLPLLANADYAIAETGGRIYKLIDNEDDGITQTPVLLDDSESESSWRTKIEEICGPIETSTDLPLEQRQGLLWDWCRELLLKYNIQSDIRDYTCCFRVDCNKQQQPQQSEDILRDLIQNNKLPNGISCATNLGKYDFFPSISGKGNAVKYILNKLSISKHNAVALFDDENDLDMANNCYHACVMGCTHESISKQIIQNKHWNVAKQSGVFATEEILELLLEHILSHQTKKED